MGFRKLGSGKIDKKPKLSTWLFKLSLNLMLTSFLSVTLGSSSLAPLQWWGVAGSESNINILEIWVVPLPSF